jgi:hypothetical protein
LLGAKTATKISKLTQRLGQFLRWARLRSSNFCFMPMASASLSLHCPFHGPVAVSVLATAQGLTPVNVAELLVWLPALLVTTTRNLEPLSAGVVAGVA